MMSVALPCFREMEGNRSANGIACERVVLNRLESESISDREEEDTSTVGPDLIEEGKGNVSVNKVSIPSLSNPSASNRLLSLY